MYSQNPEILAPAGSPDALMAAIESGANAVYLGLKSFNARGNAVNFSLSDLAHYAPLATEKNVKIYLTLNTIVKMNEMGPILEELAQAADCGIHGVILQDIGLNRVIAKYFPKLRRHASTQLAIHNLDGVRFCVDEGFERVVLARELTFAEIRDIRAAFSPETIELEVFCHGAMCYTYSGMCFFSGSVGGRSGNRGECAYTCRKGYKILNDTQFPMAPQPLSHHNYLFSMKDMNTLDVLPDLVATGIDSLKIEGRRKGPAYVSASVQAYRDRLDNRPTQDKEKDLSLAFGRQYTRAFYQRGQYGDAPVDITATGTHGIHIGTLDKDGSFVLKQNGLQRFDGIRFIFPDGTGESLAFKDYHVKNGDRNRPLTGSRISFKNAPPPGTKVMWIRSQEVEQRYRPKDHGSGNMWESIPTTVDITATFKGGELRIHAVSPYGQASETLEISPSDKGKTIPVKSLLFRFGDSPFHEGLWHGPEEIDGFLPFSQLKKARRRLLAEMEEKVGQGRKQSISQMVEDALQARPRVGETTAEPQYVMRVDRLDLLEAIVNWDQAYRFQLDFVMRPTISTPQWNKCLTLLAAFPGKVRLALPLVLRNWDTRVIRARLAKMKDQAQELYRHWVISNPGHFSLLSDALGKDITLHADFSLYHINTWSVSALEDMGVNGRLTLSLEDDRPNMEALLQTVDPSAFEVIAYTDTPLFIAEACSLAALYGGCPGAKACGHETLHIENEHGDQFQVRHDRCRSTVIGNDALSWSGSLDWFAARGVSHFRADFTVREYELSQVQAIMDALVADREISGTHSENLNRILL